MDEPSAIETPSNAPPAPPSPPSSTSDEAPPEPPSPVERRLAAVQRVLAKDSVTNGREQAGQETAPAPSVASQERPEPVAAPREHATALPLGRMRKVPPELDWYDDAAGLLGSLLENLPVLGAVVGMRLQIPEGGARLLDPGCALVVDERDTSNAILVADRGASSDESLGLLLRHMVSTESRNAVWVSTDDRPEHAAIIRWLNDATAVRISMVRIAAVEVNDRPVALVFVTAVRAPAR